MITIRSLKNYLNSICVIDNVKQKKTYQFNCGWHVGHPQLNLNGPSKAESGQQRTAHLSQCKGANPLIYIKRETELSLKE